VGNDRDIADFENSLAVKRRQLDKMAIRAPFDGVISAVDVWPGDLIGGSAPVASIITLARRVEAKISEEDFADIRVGQKASVRLLGYGNQQFDAKVTRVLPTADPDTQRYTIYLDVDIPKERLVPGLTGEVSVVVGQRHAKTIIPRRALSGDSVYVVEDGRVQLRHVETGYVSLTQVEILKGLKPGDPVIVEELDTFRAGQRVKTELLSQK
jgi:RND family efflux transporter MFP subunit